MFTDDQFPPPSDIADRILEDVAYWAVRKNVGLLEEDAKQLALTVAAMPTVMAAQRGPIKEYRSRSSPFMPNVCEALNAFAADKFTDLYLRTFPIPVDQTGFTFIRRMVEYLLPTGRTFHTAVWPTFTATSFQSNIDVRSDAVLTNWNEARRPISLSHHHGFLLDRPAADGPALFFNRPDGTQELEYWRHGRRHRDPKDGPAMFTIHGEEVGTRREDYYVDGDLHRNDGPASVIVENGVAISETWFRCGRPHRVDGPALIHRDTHGNVALAQIWHDGSLIETTIDVYGANHLS